MVTMILYKSIRKDINGLKNLQGPVAHAVVGSSKWSLAYYVVTSKCTGAYIFPLIQELQAAFPPATCP